MGYCQTGADTNGGKWVVTTNIILSLPSVNLIDSLQFMIEVNQLVDG